MELGILGGRESGSVEENGDVLGVFRLVLVVEEWRGIAGGLGVNWGWICWGLKVCGGLVQGKEEC